VRPALLSPLLHLAFPILRPERIQFLIEKAAELGVTDFHPISMQHSQKTTAQAEKYKDYAQNAVQQSERFTLPTFHGLLPFKEFMKNTHDFTCVVAVEREINVPLSSTLSIFDNHLEKPSLILIGPEGGFSKEEKLMLLSNDAWHKVSLGPFILRAETAALVMLSFASTRHMTA
jgi:16S rRNA (uracil1498-N3)-methyltransferase